ncbi:MAG: NADPH-dependent 7-cyano-7-deazaguanine reductase QueF [Proteobacteria bacterium]|nr:NADPH-dependent 7-cyano-7-deazaguanine reductase QueF [Pseudomonadota bacterium]
MENPLGKQSGFPPLYCPEVLYRVARNREDLAGMGFFGFDRWVCYELSWLDRAGTPQVGIGQLIVPASSPYIVESKSLKLYLGSFSFESFGSPGELAGRISADLTGLLATEELRFELRPLTHLAALHISAPMGRSIDLHQAPVIRTSAPAPELLRCDSEMVTETLHSNLFRSLCPVTAQPDFASVEIHYSGRKIEEQSLLQYLCSFRNAAGFHEHCCELIFYHLSTVCTPETLRVICNFTRRGGIEINPHRYSRLLSESPDTPAERRFVRQ